MIAGFFDPVAGGFFDAESSGEKSLGVLGTRRKPFQDSPTPAGDPSAAIALLRLHAYTNDLGYREKAERTLELLAGMAGQLGLYAATYGIAAVHFSQPHTQVVIIGAGEAADRMQRTALATFDCNRSVLRLASGEAVAQNLPPALAETIPHFTGKGQGKTLALVCSGFACQPPVFEENELARLLPAEPGAKK